jgi:hypothetical protein
MKGIPKLIGCGIAMSFFTLVLATSTAQTGSDSLFDSTDYRKFAIWRVLAPYLLNIRALSQDDAYSIIDLWLEKCNKICRLNFVPSYRIKAALKSSRDFLPISHDKLKVENQEFYNLLQNNGVLTKTK